LPGIFLVYPVQTGIMQLQVRPIKTYCPGPDL
jgi:hypothetical protein